MFNIGQITNPVSFSGLDGLLMYLIQFAISASIIIAVVALIVAGFKYILAMGDEDKIKSATRSLVFALIGLVVVFIAPLVVQFVMSNLGVK
jgi:hypothetical protein